MLKFNPFQPNKIVAPGMFMGRVDELKTIERCLFQTKHGNPQHFLIQGERGIGKSSLLMYVDIAARGMGTFEKDVKFNFVTTSIDLGGCHSQVDIIRTLARGLKQSIAEQQKTKEAARRIVDFLGNWEVLGVRYHKQDSEVDPDEIADELIVRIAEFCNHLKGNEDGLLILIDEADQPSADSQLGQMVKYLTERLTKKDCNNLLVGMAGLPSVLSKLRESHESSPRLFETMVLEPLTMEERKAVVRTGLKQAKSKNQFETAISDTAIEMIADMSEGYPHFVQQFAYSAFEEDDDNLISDSDVLQGAHKENGAIAQLGAKYFNELYFGRIGSNDYRLVLNSMAEHSDSWIHRKDITRESRVKESTVNNALNALKARNIIIVDETRAGYYRLPTKSFAAWINAIKKTGGKSSRYLGGE